MERLFQKSFNLSHYHTTGTFGRGKDQENMRYILGEENTRLKENTRCISGRKVTSLHPTPYQITTLKAGKPAFCDEIRSQILQSRVL